jgi:deoxyribodipyrimidine photolyase-related protein
MKSHLDIKYVKEYPKNNNEEQIFMFDVVDKVIEKEIISHYKKINSSVTILETPNFMTSRIDLQKFYDRHKNKFTHSSFYAFQLKLHDVKYITKNYDIENRNTIPKNTKIPDLKKQNTNKYVTHAIKFVENNYPQNYGETDNFYIPINHDDSKKWFDDFLKNKADKFAEYQDAIIPEEPFLYHSVISAIMNIGLLNPIYIIDKITKTYEDKKISINDYEAFVRQVIGWREYQRLIYIFLGDKIKTKNYFENKNKLTKQWYDGNTGILPVDDTIKMAFTYGYIHHILRLMVMCNFMNLCGIHPDQVYKWFMEFSTDSYEWVMIGNVYGMGMWTDGGLTMRKPYFSSYNYIKNMSGNRYPVGQWEKIWHCLYYNFLIKNEEKLQKTIYIRNISHLKTFSDEKIKEIKFTSKNIIEKITKKL